MRISKDFTQLSVNSPISGEGIENISTKFNSKIPKEYDELISLPGIGDYTAKAIMGIGYNESVMPLDANIERIFARLYALNQPLVKIKKQLQEKSQYFCSKKQSSNLIQSFMDYGSLICTPRNPNCSICLIQKYCMGHEKNLQNQIPIKLKKLKIKPTKYTRAYVLMNEKNEILVRTRSSKGMLASMLEVPNDNWEQKNKPERRFFPKLDCQLLRGVEKSDFSFSSRRKIVREEMQVSTGFSMENYIRQTSIQPTRT